MLILFLYERLRGASTILICVLRFEFIQLKVAASLALPCPNAVSLTVTIYSDCLVAF